MISAPLGCALCSMGVHILNDSNILSCDRCAHGGTGFPIEPSALVRDQMAGQFVQQALVALASVREMLFSPSVATLPDATVLMNVREALRFLRGE